MTRRERRVCPRRDIQCSGYTTRTHAAHRRDARHECMVNDISEGGCHAVVHCRFLDDYSIGEEVEIELHGFEAPILGHVVHVEKLSLPHFLAIGLAFDTLPNEDRETIHKLAS